MRPVLRLVPDSDGSGWTVADDEAVRTGAGPGAGADGIA